MLAREIVELADATVRRRRPRRMAWSWGEGLLLYALLRLDEHLGEARYRWFVEAYFARHAGRAERAVTWSDECPPALAALELYELTRRVEYLALAAPVAHYLRTAPRTRDGGLNHFGSSRWSRIYPQSMWVDSLMMYAVFAARFGRALDDEGLLRFAAEQAPLFARVLRDPATGLFRHAWWVRWQRTVPSGSETWLRGNGWVLASIAAVLEALPTAHGAREPLGALFSELATAVVRYQLPSGLFPTVLGRTSYEETSGSALIAYALFSGVHAGYLAPILEVAASRAYRALLAGLERRSDGPSMSGISTATMPYPAWGYALIPRVRDAPHGVAALMLAGIAASSPHGAARLVNVMGSESPNPAVGGSPAANASSDRWPFSEWTSQ
jgi:unsaturated rhamnogalacturonyl hydrolase